MSKPGGGGDPFPTNQFVKADYKYKYNGKEWQDELGLNWDSFKYRNYDPAIGRFMSIDPLAEKYAYQSPYNFAENRVIWARELEGLEAWYTNTGSTDPDGEGMFKAQSGPLATSYAKDAGYTSYGVMEEVRNYSFSNQEIQSFSDWNAANGPTENGHCLGCAITGSEMLTGADAGFRDSAGINQMDGKNAYDLGQNLVEAGNAVELPTKQWKETNSIVNNPNSAGTENTAYVAGISAAWHTIIITHNTNNNNTFSIFDQGTGWDKKNTTQSNVQGQINEMNPMYPNHGSRMWQLFKTDKVEVNHPIE